MKKRNRRVELVGRTRVIRLKYGHTFLAKPGFIIVRTNRNTYVSTFINEWSVRFYQGTPGGGLLQTDIDPRAFSRRFNIAESFMWETIVPKMRERILEWDSCDAMLDESMAIAVNASKKYRAEELCEDIEYLILDSVTNGDKSASWFVSTKTDRGVYEHRTIPAVFNTDTEDGYDSEGFVVLTKQRLAKLCEAEARLYAAADCECELSIDVDYGELFKESTSEGFRYKHPESFEDYVLKNLPMWRKPVEKLPPNWWRETLDTDTEE